MWSVETSEFTTMGLKIQQRIALKGKTITLLIAAFVLVAQPLYGFVANAITANATSTVTDHIVINEADTFANNNDWVELYNPTDVAISLVGYSVKELENPAKTIGKFSANEIAAGGFVVVDFDNHLSKDGDIITLYSGSSIVDTLNYGNKFLGVNGVASVQSNASRTISRIWDGASSWSADAMQSRGVSNGAAPVVVTPASEVDVENFNTVDDNFKGISVGFNTKYFGTVTAVSVQLTRADKSIVTKNANQGVLDIINNNDSGAQLTAPFIIQAGTFNENQDLAYWAPASTADWTNDTLPVSVKIIITDENGPKAVTNMIFQHGAPSWPAYESILPIVPDTTRPVIVFDAPQEGQAIKDDLIIDVEMSDNIGHGATAVANLYKTKTNSELQDTLLEQCRPAGPVMGSTYHRFTCTFSTTAYEDGNYYLKVGTTDAAGNNRTIVRKFIIDNSKPVVSIVSPIRDSMLASGGFTISGTASDSISGIDRVEIVANKLNQDGSFAGRAIEFKLATVTNDTFNYQVGELTDGRYALRAVAYDRAGNSKTSGYDISIDATTPSANLYPYANPISVRASNNNLNLYGTALDDNFNYYYCYVTKVGGREVGTRGPQCQTAWAFGMLFKTAFAETLTGTDDSLLGHVNLAGLTDGEYTAHLAVKDKAGNMSHVSTDFILDNERPVVTIAAPAANSYNPNGVTIAATDNTAVKAVTGNLYYADDTLYRGSSSAKSPFFVDLSQLTDGKYYVKYNAVDTAGNISNTEKFYFTVDKTAPIASMGSHSNNDEVAGNVELVGGVNDANPMNTHFLIKGPNGYEKTDAKNDGSREHRLDWNVSKLVNGVYAVQFEAQDQAGNKDAVSTKVIDIIVANPQPIVVGVLPTPVDTPPAAEETGGTTTSNTSTRGSTFSALPLANLQTPANIFFAQLGSNDDAATADDTAVLGTQSTNADDASVKGSRDSTVAAIDTDNALGGLFGLAWYWWLVLVAAAASIWYAVARRRSQDM